MATDSAIPYSVWMAAHQDRDWLGELDERDLVKVDGYRVVQFEGMHLQDPLRNRMSLI